MIVTAGIGRDRFRPGRDEPPIRSDIVFAGLAALPLHAVDLAHVAGGEFQADADAMLAVLVQEHRAARLEPMPQALPAAGSPPGNVSGAPADVSLHLETSPGVHAQLAPLARRSSPSAPLQF